MTTSSSTLKEDVRKDPRSLEREADRARADVEATLAALERRLSPNELFDHAVHSIKENGGDFGRNLMTQVRNNPVPTLLAGIGLTWLIAGSNSAPRATASSSTGATLGDRAVSEGVADATRQIRDRYDAMSRQQPLVLGALAVAAGVAIGALLRTTDTENEWLGRASDETKDRLRDEATRQWQDTQAAAADAAEAAERAALAELTGDADSPRQEPRRSEPAEGLAVESSPRREADSPGGLGRESGQRR